jgi:predicted dehydrogenase
LQTEEIEPVPVQYERHVSVIDQFLNWLDGGEAPEATLEDNLKSVAMVFAAIEASATNQTVNVEAMVAEARAAVGQGG